MIKKYDKDGTFHREIELAFNRQEKKYELTKRNVFSNSSQGQSSMFTETEIRYLKELIEQVVK